MGGQAWEQRAAHARRAYTIGIAAFAALSLLPFATGAFEWLAVVGVDAMHVPFGDACTVTGAGIALERGLDPQLVNPGDPWSRPLNYPSIWLLLPLVGVGLEHTPIVAATYWSAMLLAVFALRRLVHDPMTAAILLAGVFAPTSWLLLERGNNDALMFGLCVLALVRARHVRRSLAAAAIALAAILKLFPIAAVALFVTPDRRLSLRRILPLLAGFACYLVWIADELPAIFAGTDIAYHLAYGLETLPVWFAKNSPGPVWLWHLLFASALLVVLAFAWRLRSRMRLAAAGDQTSRSAFLAGSTIYLGTFALGHSFDYRLVFLLLTLPQLCHWQQRGPWLLRRAATIQLTTVMLLLWSLAWRHWLATTLDATTIGLAADEWLSWLAWCGLAIATVMSLPEWLLPHARRGAPTVDASRDDHVRDAPPIAPSPPREHRLPGA